MNLPDLFKSLVWNVLMKTATADAMAALGLGAGGPLGMILAWIIGKVSDIIYAQIIIFVQLETIVLKDEVHQKQFANAQIKLAVIAKEKGVDSPEFKDAHAKEQNDFYNLVRFGSNPLIIT